MEQRNNLVLQGTETFSRGQLDNVALESGSIVLDSAAGRYLQYGSYTTPELSPMLFIMSEQVLCRACFRRLMPS